MTSPNESSTGVPSVGPGTDVTADPDALATDTEDKPATSDPAEFDEDGEDLGGTGGENAGGAG
jgi:hypothetical protein